MKRYKQDGQQYLKKVSRFETSNKSEIQSHLTNDVDIFLANGGKVTKCPPQRVSKKRKF